MHDMTTLEQLGIPSVFVASTEFYDAAQTQARALGFDPAGVFVQHPIQDRTDQEIRVLAEEALDRIIRALVD